MATTTALVIAGVGAAASSYAAVKQNQAVRDTAAATRSAAATQMKQISDAAAIEKRKADNKAAQVRGRIRVAAASAGIGIDGGSFEALSNQAVTDQAMNLAILEQNRKNEIARVASGATASLSEIQSRIQNVLLASIQGGLAGAQTGLAIGGAFDSKPPVPEGDTIGGSGGRPSFGGPSAGVYA